MTIKEALHQFVDEDWEKFMKRKGLDDLAEKESADTFEEKPYADSNPSVPVVEELPKESEETMPEKTSSDKRAVRTPLSGDKVYLLDEKEMTKKWIRTPEMLKDSGFDLGSVIKIEDAELAKYKLSL